MSTGVAIVVLLVVFAAVAGAVFALKGGDDKVATQGAAPTTTSDQVTIETTSEPPSTTVDTTIPPSTVATTTTTAPTAAADAGLSVADPPSDEAEQAAVSSLSAYFDAINAHDFDTAHALLSPAMQAKVSRDQMQTDGDTTHDTDVVVESIAPGGDGVLLAVVTFTSNQSIEDSPTGTSCNRWRIRYQLVPGSDTWVIDRATGVDGAKAYRPC